MARFNRCPNCGKKPGGFLSGSYFDIYECADSDCQTCYCYDCGGKRCPNCGTKKRKKVGECWGPKN